MKSWGLLVSIRRLSGQQFQQLISHRLLHTTRCRAPTTFQMITSAFTHDAMQDSSNVSKHHIGFYTRRNTGLQQHSQWSTQLFILTSSHTINVMQTSKKFAERNPVCLNTERAAWPKKPNEGIRINLYTVAKSVRPRLPMYSGWGMRNDVFAWVLGNKKRFGFVCFALCQSVECWQTILHVTTNGPLRCSRDLFIFFFPPSRVLSTADLQTCHRWILSDIQMAKYLQADYGINHTPFSTTYPFIRIFHERMILALFWKKSLGKVVLKRYWLWAHLSYPL